MHLTHFVRDYTSLCLVLNRVCCIVADGQNSFFVTNIK